MPKVKRLMYTPAVEGDVLAKSIKVLLIKNDWMPEDLAKRIGRGTATVYGWLNNPGSIKYEDICKMAHVFKVKKSVLLGEEGA